MVSSEPKIAAATEKIIIFAEDHGLAIATVRGKIIKYLKRAKPDHYQALVKTGVVKDF